MIKTLTRREFIKTIMATAAILQAPALITGSSLKPEDITNMSDRDLKRLLLEAREQMTADIGFVPNSIYMSKEAFKELMDLLEVKDDPSNFVNPKIFGMNIIVSSYDMDDHVVMSSARHRDGGIKMVQRMVKI